MYGCCFSCSQARRPLLNVWTEIKFCSRHRDEERGCENGELPRVGHFLVKKSTLLIFLFFSASDKVIYLLTHHHNMSSFTMYQLKLAHFFSFRPAFSTKITTKEIGIYQLQHPRRDLLSPKCYWNAQYFRRPGVEHLMQRQYSLWSVILYLWPATCQLHGYIFHLNDAQNCHCCCPKRFTRQTNFNITFAITSITFIASAEKWNTRQTNAFSRHLNKPTKELKPSKITILRTSASILNRAKKFKVELW